MALGGCGGIDIGRLSKSHILRSIGYHAYAINIAHKATRAALSGLSAQWAAAGAGGMAAGRLRSRTLQCANLGAVRSFSTIYQPYVMLMYHILVQRARSD